MSRRAIMFAIGGIAVTALAAGAAWAQSGAQSASSGTQNTPFNYEIKDGKRVPKGTKQVNADGSWREEIRQGKCVTVKEKSAAGEYKESRKCD